MRQSEMWMKPTMSDTTFFDFLYKDDLRKLIDDIKLRGRLAVLNVADYPIIFEHI